MAKNKKTSDFMAKINAYWAKHPHYTSIVHAAGGVGFGLLLGRSLELQVNTAIAWGLIALTILGHLYAFIAE
jgi:hypothetical protein